MILSEARVSSLPEQGVVQSTDNRFTTEVDSFDKGTWDQILRDFEDTNIYQTWAYEVVRSGRPNVSHVVIKRESKVVAAAQARLIRIPYLGFGVAYIRWGPIWKRRSCPVDREVFRRILRALRHEYVVRRGLILRVTSNLFDGENEPFQGIFNEEGYVFQSKTKRSRTILMDLRPSLEELYQGLHQKWRNCLNGARKRRLEVIEGEDDLLFEAFERIYAEMKDRKQFVSSTDLGEYRQIQEELAAGEKMRVFLSKVDGDPCAGAICSGLGKSGLYLFGATSNRGMKTNASYLLQWRILEWLKERHCECYDLNGINPTENEGTYRFKSRLAGKFGNDVLFPGQFDAYPTATMGLGVTISDYVRAKLHKVRISLNRLWA